MKNINLGLTAASFSILLSLWTPVIQQDGTVGLDSASTLASFPTLSDRPTDLSAPSVRVYHLSLRLPEHSSRFSKISLTEQSQESEVNLSHLDLMSTTAFAGTPEAIGQTINTETWVDETGTVWVEFNPALSPGTQLTVAFKEKNPSAGKSYEYGIAAYPVAENSTAVFVGNETLTIGQ